MSNVMVINMGMKSIRCIIFNQQGKKLGSAALPISTAINDKCVEQNPNEWLEKIEIVIQKAIINAGNCSIEYITVTTSASCLVCVDKEGHALENVFMVSDKRAEKEVMKIKKTAEFKQIKNETGLDMSVSLMLPKILWLKNNKPEIFEKSHWFLSPNDYLIAVLCNIYVTDCLNAMKYHYDINKKQYPDLLLKKLGIPSQKLPRVGNLGECVGNLSDEWAMKTGISKKAKIVITSYDAICSFIGSGVTEEGEASDVSGTVTVFRALSKKENIKNSIQIYNLPLGIENIKIVGGSNNLGGGLIEWVKQCYYQNEKYPYQIMEKDAAESDIGAKGLIFLPYLLGERTPIWDDNARGVFFGLERMHTRKDMTRAVFESTGFIDMDIIEAIQNTNVDIQSVRLSGGLTRIPFISQLKADIMGRDVMVVSEFETTAVGAAMLVLLGQGVYSDIKTISEKFVAIRMLIKPDRENHKKYEYMYELYKDTYSALKELFVHRAKILEQIRNDREIQIENL